MPQEPHVAAEPMEITVAGRKLRIGRARLRDTFAVAEQIRDEWVEKYFSIRSRLPPQQQTEVLARLLTTNVSEKERIERTLSPIGAIFLLWRTIQRYQPEITQEQVAQWADEEPGLVDLVLFESGLAGPQKTDAKGEPIHSADPTPESSPRTGSPSSPASGGGSG